LVLDTAEDEAQPDLYERVGFKLAGLIPDYAFKPYGGLDRHADLTGSVAEGGARLS
jgi:hypothetical protein